LKPRVGPSFTTDLLIRIARAAILSNPVRQGKSYHHLFPRISSLAIDVNPDANVEAAMYPVLNINNTACVRGAKAKMMGHD
jgi:hypothetical protein